MFLMYDREWDTSMSKSAVKRECEMTAKKMMVRNQSFSLLVQQKYPSHIRLSIHGHNNNGPKYGVRLMDHLTFIATPWHNVVVRLKDGREVLMKRFEAEELGCRLIEKYDRPWYFEQNEAAEDVQVLTGNSEEASASTQLPMPGQS